MSDKNVDVLFKGVPNESLETKKEKLNWYKVSRRISLLKNSGIVEENFKPKNIPFEENAKLLEQVAIAVSKRMPVLLIGETGTGKTSAIRHLACETNNAFVRVNHNGGTTVEDLIGRWTIGSNGTTVWVDGLLIEAAKKGMWFLADEINAASAEVNFVYHSLLDDDGRIVLVEKGNEVVIPNENFRFFAAMNPPQEYTGTKELNKALMSRFLVVKVDFPSPKVEAKILVDRTGVSQDVADLMVQCAGEIRVNHANEKIRFVLSTRDLIMWASMYKIYNKYILSAEMTILNKVPTDEIDSIRDIMGLKFKALDSAKKVGTNNSSQEDEE